LFFSTITPSFQLKQIAKIQPHTEIHVIHYFGKAIKLPKVTPQNRFILEKLILAQLVNTFHVFYET
jgi:hypothetical protein